MPFSAKVDHGHGEPAEVHELSAVHTWDEFSPLREVVLGTAVGARMPSATDISAWLNLYPDRRLTQALLAPSGPVPDRVVAEAEEDLQELQLKLETLGVKVVRPDPIDHDQVFGGPGWSSQGMYSYCPRDVTLILGETIIECPSPTRARYFETLALRRHFANYAERGAHLIAAPRPRLTDDLYSVDAASGLPCLTEAEPVFEAANVLRVGADIFYQVSTSGNEAALRWLQDTASLIGGITVHPLRDVYAYTHIDSTMSILRPGLVLLNPERLTDDTVPEAFATWDRIWCPTPVSSSRSAHSLSSPWIAMNLLMVSEELAIIDVAQTELRRQLEGKGIAVETQRMRHQEALGGGIHCVTLDLRRDGEAISYFD